MPAGDINQVQCMCLVCASWLKGTMKIYIHKYTSICTSLKTITEVWALTEYLKTLRNCCFLCLDAVVILWVCVIMCDMCVFTLIPFRDVHWNYMMTRMCFKIIQGSRWEWTGIKKDKARLVMNWSLPKLSDEQRVHPAMTFIKFSWRVWKQNAS